MRVLFDFFINIARWAWVASATARAVFLAAKILDFMVVLRR